MEEGYSAYQSLNLGVEIFRETMPFIVAAVLLYFYYRRKINIIEVLIYAIATEAYTAIVIGPTFNATFFISIFFLLEYIYIVLMRSIAIKLKYLILLLLPLISSIAVFFLVIFYEDCFYYPGDNKLAFYLRPVYFYLKTLLPLFAIGGKIVMDRNELSFDNFFATIKNVAKISCIIAVVQIAAELIFNSNDLGEFLGMQRRYLDQYANEVFSLRVQALFAEPKHFSAFMVLSLPVLLKDKEYKWACVAFIMGILSISQTFWINLLCASVVFFLLYKIQNVRLKIVTTLTIIVAIFLTIASFKEFFFNAYLDNPDSFLSKLIVERAVTRYDIQDVGRNNVILGLPLQQDLEIPVVNFFADNNHLLISGYGAGNSTFIPPDYFYGQIMYQNRLAGIGGNTLTMRWFYIIAEFGILSFILYFIILTARSKFVTSFQNNYLSFVWISFFFSQIDIVFIITVMLSAYAGKENT